MTKVVYQLVASYALPPGGSDGRVEVIDRSFTLFATREVAEVSMKRFKAILRGKSELPYDYPISVFVAPCYVISAPTTGSKQ